MALLQRSLRCGWRALWNRFTLDDRNRSGLDSLIKRFSVPGGHPRCVAGTRVAANSEVLRFST
jgi:hypothetical protein